MKLQTFCKFWLAASLLLGGCSYDNEEELFPTNGCDTNGATYLAVVQPIIQSNCYRCHDQQNNQGNITLEGHSNLVKFVNSGQLIGAIKQLSGFSPMPQDAAKLSDCNIAKIEAWISAGALNN